MEPSLRTQFKIFKYRLLNKFLYKRLEQLPKLIRVKLEVNCKSSEKMEILRSGASIRLLTNSKTKLISAQRNIEEKNIKKGKPIGIKGIVAKQKSLSFLLTLLFKFSKYIGESNWFSLQKEITKKNFLFELGYLLNLPELNTNYKVLKKLTNFVIIVKLSNSFKQETEFLWSLLNLEKTVRL